MVRIITIAISLLLFPACYTAHIKSVNQYFNCVGKASQMGVPQDRGAAFCQTRKGKRKVNKVYAEFMQKVKELMKKMQEVDNADPKQQESKQ